MPKKGSKYSALAKDPLVARWLANIGRGSLAGAEVAVRRLGKSLELLGLTPKELLAAARRRRAKLEDSLEDMVAALEAERKSPGYIIGLLKAVRSLLRYHGVILPRRIKVTNSTATPTIENEQIPTQEELARVLRRAKPRAKAAVSFMAFADLRPEVLGNFNGSDGLMLGDLPELKIEGGKVAFKKAPTMVMVRSPLSKTRHKYFTFLSGEGCTYLKEYLEERLRAGEVLGLDSPVIAHLKPATKRFITTRKITDEIREHMRAAGVRKRPYVLRAYAETQLIIAESKGKISHPYLQFVAGHKGDIEARYSTNKGRLPPDMIEDIREAYRLCEPFLGTTAPQPERESVVKEAKMEAMRTIAKNLFGMDLAEAKSTRELAEKKELTDTEEIKLYEEAIEREKHKREDQLINVLFDDPEFVETVRQKLQNLAKTKKV